MAIECKSREKSKRRLIVNAKGDLHVLIRSFEFCLIDKHTAKKKRQHKNFCYNQQTAVFFFLSCLLIVINNCFLFWLTHSPSSMSSSFFFSRVYINLIKRTLHCVAVDAVSVFFGLLGGKRGLIDVKNILAAHSSTTALYPPCCSLVKWCEKFVDEKCVKFFSIPF